MAKIKLYAFYPAACKGTPTRKTPQIETILTYENTRRIADEPTGTIFPSWDVAAKMTGEKNQILADEYRKANK